jgi:four helix bundle protein
MPSYKNFEELPVWKEGAKLYNLVLDLLEAHPALLSAGFRNQIDRAALSVPNNIAEGFDRVTTGELASFLGYARGSASEVMSMCATVMQRPKLKPALPMLREIRLSAESCLRQLSAWASQIEAGPVQGKRHRTDRAGTDRR